jgi:Zn-dependent M28 family amino/carboxypeptidase
MLIPGHPPSRARRALCAVGLAATLVACGSPHHRGPPPSNDIDEMRFREYVRTLSSEEYEGRKPGTPGEDKTVAFITAQFHRLGLKPASGESYAQSVPLVEIRAGADATLSVSGGRGALLPLGYGNDMLVFSPRATPSALLARSELVFVGYGIVAPEYHWNDYQGTSVRGKTVLVLLGDPGTASRNPGVFKGLSASAYGSWSYKLSEAARQGAAGVLLLYDAKLLGFGWSAVRNTWGGARLESPAVADDASTPAIEAWLSAEAGRNLIAQAGLDFTALADAASRPGFKGVPTGLKVSAEVHSTVRRFNSTNLVGVLPGSGGARRHEYVLYTAHWDGLGRDSSGALLPGAEDASGVAGLLVLAQSFQRTRPAPERSVAFIALTGGAPGLLGSRYYVENPLIALDQTAGVINVDALHQGGPTRDVVIFGAGNSELEDMARAAALLQGRDVRAEPHPEEGLYYTSDQINFALHGVPALEFKAGIDDSARGPEYGLGQLDDFMAHRYRQSADKYDEWKVGGALEDLKLYFQVGERLATTRRFPRWYPDSEFSASHVRAAASE